MFGVKVIWEISSPPIFPMTRGDTFFTYRDLREIALTVVPYPEGLQEIDFLFDEFCHKLELDKIFLIELACTVINPFQPVPYQLTTASFENPGYFIPLKYHRFLFEIWYRQLMGFLSQFKSPKNPFI